MFKLSSGVADDYAYLFAADYTDLVNLPTAVLVSWHARELKTLGPESLHTLYMTRLHVKSRPAHAAGATLCWAVLCCAVLC